MTKIFKKEKRILVIIYYKKTKKKTSKKLMIFEIKFEFKSKLHVKNILTQ